MEAKNSYVLAMYDVRGIQDYIFRTAKVKDAIGASAIVDNIILEALHHALDKQGILDQADLEWEGPEGELPYHESDKKVQVLYIGGGNGLLLWDNEDMCLETNKIMSKYIIEQTYSLQLAAALVPVKGDYMSDYFNLIKEMDRAKTDMLISKPLGALPVMKVETKTGYPITADPESAKQGTLAGEMSTESLRKSQKEQSVRANTDKQMKIFDNYTTKKGTDSTIAIVHIDGNNMGLRIREQIEKLPDHSYETAMNAMRRISWQIKHAYQDVFVKMQTLFNKNAGKQSEYEGKNISNFVLKILVAGDDITYVCNARIALATVDYFCREITNYEKYSMAVNEEEKGSPRYGFNFCAGIAFINSHFPFSVGYKVAESCCSNAKKYAKDKKYGKDDRIGNWIDFQICKNVQTQNLGIMRDREYRSSHGEQLLRRPYFICTKEKDWPIDEMDSRSLSSLEKNILYFQNEKNIPRTFSKNLRNTYSQGQIQADMLLAFLESRNWKMPDGSNELYEIEEDEGKNTALPIAKWYDSLEMMDYYIDLKRIEGGE